MSWSSIDTILVARYINIQLTSWKFHRLVSVTTIYLSMRTPRIKTRNTLCCGIAIASFIFAFNVYFTYSYVIGLATLVKVVAPGEGLGAISTSEHVSPPRTDVEKLFFYYYINSVISPKRYQSSVINFFFLINVC